MGAVLREDLPASWALCSARRSVKEVCSEEQGWQDPWNSPESHHLGPARFLKDDGDSPGTQHSGLAIPGSVPPVLGRTGWTGPAKGRLGRCLLSELSHRPNQAEMHTGRKRRDRNRPGIFSFCVSLSVSNSILTKATRGVCKGKEILIW